MPQFMDRKGRAWTVEVTVAAVKRVRSLIGWDLCSVYSGDTADLLKLETDPVLLVDVLYCLVQPQAEKLGVSDVDFGEAMAGEAIDAGHEALWESLRFFPRDPAVRKALGEVAASLRAARAGSGA